MGFDVVLTISADSTRCAARRKGQCLPKRYKQTTLCLPTVDAHRESSNTSLDTSQTLSKVTGAPSIKAAHRLHKSKVPVDTSQQEHDYLRQICFGHPTKTRSSRRRRLRNVGGDSSTLTDSEREGDEWSQPQMYEDAAMNKLCKIVKLAEALKEAKTNRIAQSEYFYPEDLVVFTQFGPTPLEICSYLHKEVSEVLKAEMLFRRLVF